MKFIINKRIRYHEDNSSIDTLDNSAEPVILTATLNRLLALFVKNNNLVLSREHVLTTVWEEHGQVASDNNLNNSMSQLRKILASFGEEDILVTLPRQGFTFTAQEINTIDDQIIINEQSLAQSVPSPVAHPTLKAILLLLVCLLSGVLAFLAINFVNNSGVSPDDSIELGAVDNCHVSIMSAHHKVAHSQLELNTIKAKIDQLGLRCQIPAKIYYYDTDLLTQSASGQAHTRFIAYCPLTPGTQQISRCENYYENEKL
ncbi:winged helix-turn-helix domain-containing protein [Serratia marcescens]|uniref:winged helix-turn-helix domain-containing protein n=1 Tax=Serratia marcescens TaxID=615 RepID=UPI003204F61C